MAKTLQQLADYIQTEPDIRALINETVRYLQAAWPPSGNVELPIHQRIVTLDNEQIKSTPTAPVEVVPAPGVGYGIFVNRVIYAIKTVVPYKESDNSDLGAPGSTMEITWGANEYNASSTLPLDNINWNGKFRLVNIGSNVFDNEVDFTVVENKALCFAMDPITGLDLIGGDAANSISIAVEYIVIPVPS